MTKQKTIPQLETEKAENERKLSQLQHKNNSLKTASPTTKKVIGASGRINLFRHLVLLFRRMADVLFFLPLEGIEPICLQIFRHAPRQLETSREAHQL